jgi:hypothetical protein
MTKEVVALQKINCLQTVEKIYTSFPALRMELLVSFSYPLRVCIFPDALTVAAGVFPIRPFTLETVRGSARGMFRHSANKPSSRISHQYGSCYFIYEKPHANANSPKPVLRVGRTSGVA